MVQMSQPIRAALGRNSPNTSASSHFNSMTPQASTRPTPPSKTNIEHTLTNTDTMNLPSRGVTPTGERQPQQAEKNTPAQSERCTQRNEQSRLILSAMII